MNTLPLLIVVAVLGLLWVTRSWTGLGYYVDRISHYQKRLSKPIEEQADLAVLTRRKEREPVDLTEIRDLVITLQLGTSMADTLTGAMEKAAEQFANRGRFGERLHDHVEARLYSLSPAAVLQGLVDDFESDHLGRLLERVNMASEGGLSYNRVFTLTSMEIQEDIVGDVRQKIERIPVRLNTLMTAGLFPPVMLLLLIPLLGGFAGGGFM